VETPARSRADARATQPDEELRGPEQVLSLNNERFTVPELLLNPSVITMP
jgi:hypothetical protein